MLSLMYKRDVTSCDSYLLCTGVCVTSSTSGGHERITSSTSPHGEENGREAEGWLRGAILRGKLLRMHPICTHLISTSPFL